MQDHVGLFGVLIENCLWRQLVSVRHYCTRHENAADQPLTSVPDQQTKQKMVSFLHDTQVIAGIAFVATVKPKQLEPVFNYAPVSDRRRTREQLSECNGLCVICRSMHLCIRKHARVKRLLPHTKLCAQRI